MKTSFFNPEGALNIWKVERTIHSKKYALYLVENII